MSEKPNIIFIVMDAVRARNLSCYGYDKPTSPNIDRLAKDGVLFENAFSCTTGTDPSLTTIFSGMYPLRHGIIQHGELVTDKQMKKVRNVTLLPELLKDIGYYTIGLDWLGRWHKRGYDYYMGVTDSRKSVIMKIYRKILKLKSLYNIITKFYRQPLPKMVFGACDAEVLTNFAIEWIKKSRNPFFIFIHYWDTHAPYNAPDYLVDEFKDCDNKYQYPSKEQILSNIIHKPRRDYVERMIDEFGQENIPARYDASIRYVDMQIGKIINELPEDIIENTIIVITADHGESMFEHNVYFDHVHLYDDIIHVPLIMRYPGCPKNKRVEGLVQHVDILPTVLDILKVKSKLNIDGNSLVTAIKSEGNGRSEIFAMESCLDGKMCIRTKRYKYISATKTKNWQCIPYKRVFYGEELYDLKKDPRELNNLIDTQQENVIELRDKLYAWLSHVTKKFEGDVVRYKIKRLKIKKKKDGVKYGNK